MNLDDPSLSSLIRQNATRHSAPDTVRAAVLTQVALADVGRSEPPVSPPRKRSRSWPDFSWRTASVSFCLGLTCALLFTPVLQRMSLDEPLDVDLVSDHVRALRVGPLTEVVSSDRHTVKPWFQGRLDYAPPVFDLASDGFPLMGGRIEQVRGNGVATLSYARNRHVIDVFIWPSSAPQAPVRSLRKGFNVLHWADGSMEYWAISDLERPEMERFTQVWQQRSAAQ